MYCLSALFPNSGWIVLRTVFSLLRTGSISQANRLLFKIININAILSCSYIDSGIKICFVSLDHADMQMWVICNVTKQCNNCFSAAVGSFLAEQQCWCFWSVSSRSVAERTAASPALCVGLWRPIHAMFSALKGGVCFITTQKLPTNRTAESTLIY